MLVVNFVDSTDVRMIQCRSGLGFALKASECLWIFGYVVQELESNKTSELHILRLADDAHTAAAQLLKDAVMRDGLADYSGDGWFGVASSYGATFRELRMVVIA